MWTTTERDTFYLFNHKADTIYQESLTTFWNNQLAKAGLTPYDSVPEKMFPVLLEFDMDSAKLVFNTINLYRNAPDSAYRISYFNPNYYLKKK